MDRGTSVRASSGRRIIRALVGLLLAMLALAPGAGAATRRPPRSVLRHDLMDRPAVDSHLLLQPFFKGSGTSFLLGGNDLGTAVGQLVTPSGISHPIMVIGRTGFDLYPQYGAGAFDAISPTGSIVGQLGGHPAFIAPGQAPISLGVDGVASAIALGDVVAVNENSSQGSEAVLWIPSTGYTWAIGPDRIASMNSNGWLVGSTDTGHPFAAHVDHGQISRREFSGLGAFVHVNGLDLAIGFKTVHGGPRPFEVNLVTGSERFLERPRGYGYESLLYDNDANLIVGNAFRTRGDFKSGTATPVIYPSGPRHPVLVRGLAIAGRGGIRLADVDTVSDGGIMFGAGALGGFDFAIRMHPLPAIGKMRELGDILDEDDYYGDLSDRLFLRLEDAYYYIDDGNLDRACLALGDANDLLTQEASELIHSSVLGPIAKLNAYVFYNDIAGTVLDLEDELGCLSDLSSLSPLGMPLALSPYSPWSGSR